MSNTDENECPICATIPTGKIFQCKEGHIVCESCLRKIQENAERSNVSAKCPYCAGPLDKDAVSRVRVLENLLDSRTIDCCHAESGCAAKLKRSEIDNHESTCTFGQGLRICEIFGDANCNFELSALTAKTVFQHIETCHPLKTIQKRKFSDTYNLKEAWESVCSAERLTVKFTNIAQVPHSQKQQHVLIISKVSKDSVCFYGVDLALSLSTAAKPRVNFSISDDTDTLISWSIPVTCGMESWKFLRDKKCKKPIEIGIQSLLQHCDQKGNVKINFVVEQQKATRQLSDLYSSKFNTVEYKGIKEWRPSRFFGRRKSEHKIKDGY